MYKSDKNSSNNNNEKLKVDKLDLSLMQELCNDLVA